MIINSNPPGAMVYIDDYEIGKTPVATNFTYYGSRNFRLELDGYQTIIENRKIAAPWYQVPPLDFVSENLSPCDIRDHRQINFCMRPMPDESEKALLERGEKLRQYRCPQITGSSYNQFGSGNSTSAGMNSRENHYQNQIAPDHQQDYNNTDGNTDSQPFPSDDTYQEADPYQGAAPGTLPITQLRNAPQQPNDYSGYSTNGYPTRHASVIPPTQR